MNRNVPLWRQFTPRSTQRDVPHHCEILNTLEFNVGLIPPTHMLAFWRRYMESWFRMISPKRSIRTGTRIAIILSTKCYSYCTLWSVCWVRTPSMWARTQKPRWHYLDTCWCLQRTRHFGQRGLSLPYAWKALFSVALLGLSFLLALADFAYM